MVLTTRNFDSGFLAGHEFRQAQTGISINFIQRDQDYALAYPTPLFGPPWSIPMEFPLYQWISAWIGTQLDLTVAESGRAVSITFFYLCLPAMVLLLRNIRMESTHINYVLTLVLTAPVFIYYSRAVLIESTALCWSLWFLYGFVRLSRSPHWRWWLLTAICGSLAALVKVTTFMVWGTGALVGGIWWFAKIRQSGDTNRANRNLMWAALSAVPPMIAGIWWVGFSDTIKRNSPDGQFLTSAQLRDFNLGSAADRVDSEIWNELLQNFSLALFPASLLVILGLVTILLIWQRRVFLPLILTLWAITVWCAFPGLYQIHDYYFYAMALLPVLAIGFTLKEVSRSSVGRTIAPALVVTISALQLRGYFEDYAPTQFMQSNGGGHMENFIRDTFPTDSVVLMLGYDWSPSLPYFMQRRCLMIRDVLTQDRTALNTLFDRWTDVPVGGFLVANSYRENTELIATITDRFELETSVIVTDGHADLRVVRDLRHRLHANMAEHPNNHKLQRPAGAETLIAPEPNTDLIVADGEIHPVTSNQAESVFYLIHPAPKHYRTQLGIGTGLTPQGYVMITHPGGEFWVNVDANATTITAEFGLQEEVYQDPHDHSDGVSFQILAVDAAGAETQILERYIDPFNHLEERGKLKMSFPLPHPLPARLRFAVLPGESDAYDWAFWGNVVVQ